MKDHLVSLTEFARRLGVCEATARKIADRGELPVLLTERGHRFFAPADVEEFLARRAQQRGAAA